jgi:hypothetical protein
MIRLRTLRGCMNEDEHGITPPDVTAITVEPAGSGWLITIEQGNGNVIKTVELTEMERMQLGMMLDSFPGRSGSVSFVDFSRF